MLLVCSFSRVARTSQVLFLFQSKNPHRPAPTPAAILPRMDMNTDTAIRDTAIARVARGSVLVLGNFDGVHLGHQAVIAAARDRANALETSVSVLTLEPHPRTLFKPNHPPFRLTPPEAKRRLLRALGVEDVITLNFTPELASLSAPDFVRDILIRDYGVKHVVAGHDFVFGYKRGGTMKTLRELLAPYSVDVTEVAPFLDSGGHIMSSSRTREALHAGDLLTAEHILGRPWSISGKVVRGAQRARALGFPTANIELGDYLRPKFGVYVVRARRAGASENFTGVANIGNRPTVDGLHELLEFHLFDFHSVIYDEEWEVELLHYLRPERKFDDFAALSEQIGRDVEQAKAWLARRMS